MILGYTYAGQMFSSEQEQKKMICNYAQKYQFGNVKIRSIPLNKNILSYRHAEGDTVIISDISVFGNKFEEIINGLKFLSSKKVRIFSIKEDLILDGFSPYLVQGMLDSCLKIYKGSLSIKNKKIQTDLLENGKVRGRPKRLKNKEMN